MSDRPSARSGTLPAVHWRALRTIGALFVAPAATARERPPRDHPEVAVVSSAADAVTAGAALGLALLGIRRAPCVVVAVWVGAPDAPPGIAAPAGLAARRLAGRLTHGGHRARPSGRIVHVSLPVAEVEAVAAAERVRAAVGDLPVVVAVGGPRTAAFDRLLAQHRAVVVATSPDADPELALLAADALPLPSSSVVRCVLAGGWSTHTLARAGLALGSSLRAALRPAIETLT